MTDAALIALADRAYESGRTAYSFGPGAYSFDAMQACGFLKSKIRERSREAFFIVAWGEYHTR